MFSIKIRKYYFRALAVFFFFEILISKSFSIKKVKIESIIRSSGIVEFNENRTFDFRGKFSYAYQDIPKKFYRNIYDIAVSEGGIPYKNIIKHCNSIKKDITNLNNTFEKFSE